MCIPAGRAFLAEGTENAKVPHWKVASSVAGTRKLV